MEMSYREQLNDHRPYWKVIVSLAFSLLATVLGIFLGFKFLSFFMPFVVGWFIAYLVSPIVNWLEKHLKIVKTLGSALTIILVLAAVIGILYYAGSRIVHEILDLIQNLPELYNSVENGFDSISGNMDGFLGMLPTWVQEGLQELAGDFRETTGNLMSKISEPTVYAAGRFAKKIPAILVGIIVSILSAYFFVAERENLIDLSKKVAPDPLVKRMTIIIKDLKYAVGGYFLAQFKIMGVMMIILILGFMIIGINFSFLLALLIAFLDFLPFLGTAISFVPWAIYEFMIGNYRLAISLLVLYAVTQLVRQVIQPKFVGDSVGLNPLLTLVLIYIGYKVGSVLGMIFAVPIGMIVINLFKAGAFDYILNDVKILVEGVLSLRK